MSFYVEFNARNRASIHRHHQWAQLPEAVQGLILAFAPPEGEVHVRACGHLNDGTGSAASSIELRVEPIYIHVEPDPEPEGAPAV